VIVGNGTPGPYPLGRLFIDTATIEVSRVDSGFLPPWTFVSKVNGLLFSDPMDSAATLHIRFETDYYGLPKIYSFYEKRYETFSDSIRIRHDSLTAPVVGSAQHDNLVVSGYKTVGVSMGSFGQLNLEQGLDVRIGGEIRPGTELSAHLSDEGTSLEGSTREISDFDMIYVALTDPRFNVVAGDQFIEWPIDGILQGKKKIKGISASVSPKAASVSAFGALAGGNFTVQTWRGDGGQGPYTFTGKGESGFITPIGGTVKVTVNGKTCEEGEDESFVVDYDLGTLTFTARLLISQEDIIRVEYEYKMFDYQRTMAGATAKTAFSDSAFTVTGALWSEIDNKNNPIELLITEKEKKMLRACGDSPPLDTAVTPVDPNDVYDLYATVPLYIKKDTLGTTIFVHKIPDPSNPLKNDSLFDVEFSPSDECGDYTRDDSAGLYVYTYAGPCNGGYSPLATLSAPQRTTSGEVRAELDLPLLQAAVDFVGQEYDRNLFSSIDDDDNLASAADISATIGKKSYDSRAFWLGGGWQYWSEMFNGEGLSAFDRKTSWNDYSLDESSASSQTWEATIGATPVANMSADVTYGQKLTHNDLTTDKISFSTRLSPLSHLRLSCNGSYFRHFNTDAGEDTTKNGSGHRQEALASLLFARHTATLSMRDEWRVEGSSAGAGLAEGGFRYEFIPLHLSEEFLLTKYRSGGRRLPESRDTGAAFTWKQSVDCKPLSRWSINGTSAWQSRRSYNIDGDKRASTLLLDLVSRISPSKKGFSSRQQYSATAEKATRYIQVPTYVGEGQGTHKWDSTRNEYVEDPQGVGSFIIQQREFYDSTTNSRLRKTKFTLEWELRPPKKEPSQKGFFETLALEGALSLEEHVDATVSNPSSWLPGYLSLRNLKEEYVAQEKIPWCDLSYSQQILWSPSNNRDFRGRFMITPDYLRIRSYREPAITTELNLELKRKKTTLENNTRLFYLFHDDTSRTGPNEDFYLRDINTTFTQRRTIAGSFELSLAECLGLARQDTPGQRKISRNIDSVGYGQLTPGISWQIGDIGSVEASYTFSLVTLPSGCDYRIAKGFAQGVSHVISLSGNARIAKNFSINGSYRGEILRNRSSSDSSGRSEHLVSLEVQAFL